MNQPIRIFVADDHPTVRRGIRDLLETELDLEAVGEAKNGRVLCPVCSISSRTSY